MFVNYFSKISINLVYQPLSFSVSSGQSLVFDWSLEDLENPAADEVLKNGLFFQQRVQRSFILPCLPEGSSFVCTSQWCPEGCSSSVLPSLRVPGHMVNQGHTIVIFGQCCSQALEAPVRLT